MTAREMVRYNELFDMATKKEQRELKKYENSIDIYEIVEELEDKYDFQVFN